MIYGTYNHSIHGGYKATNITGGPQCIDLAKTIEFTLLKWDTGDIMVHRLFLQYNELIYIEGSSSCRPKSPPQAVSQT